jgi:hypothetical protein
MKINEMKTEDLVRFYEAVHKKHDVRFVNANTPVARRVVDKIDDVLGKALKLLDVVGIVKKIDFDLRPMCVDNYIVLNFTPASDERSPMSQINVVVHELQHKINIDDTGETFAQWLRNYYMDGQYRAFEEAKCQKAEKEGRFWYDGFIPPMSLGSGYALTGDQIGHAQMAYDRHTTLLKTCGRGMCTHMASRDVIEILKGLGVVPL